MEFQPILPAARIEAMRRAGFWRGEVLTDFFDRNLAARPDDIAIVDHNSMTGACNALTWRELAARVGRIAANLARLGIGPGDVVSYQLPNWWEFAALHLACLRVGAVTNPLMPIFRERELRFMLGLAESRLLVVPRRFRDFDYPAMAEGLRAELPRLERVLVVGGADETAFERQLLAGVEAAPAPARLRADPDAVVQLLYTSGTTGEPKGVMHTANTLFSNIAEYVARLGLSERDTVLMSSPLAHQTGFMYGLIMPIYLGCKAVLQDIWQPEAAGEIIAREGVSFTMASTPFLADLTEAAVKGPDDFRTLRIFLSAGAPIPRVLMRRAAEHLGATIVSAWGMTENGGVTTTKPDDPPEKAFETDGCALPGMEVRVVDGDGRVLSAGAEGRLQVRGCSNFVGYLKRPQLYATDEEGWFETGDLARMDGEGYIRITGRAKDIIIRGGENVPVVEVEGLIYRHPLVQECAIVAMPDARLGERACAFVVTRGSAALTLQELTRFLLEQKLSKTYLPERLELVDALPKTSSGKIQKFRLREVAKGLSPNA